MERPMMLRSPLAPGGLPSVTRTLARLGSADPVRGFVTIENARRGNNRPGEGGAASLVDTGERLREFELELEGAAPRHRVALCTPAKAGVQTSSLSYQQKI